MNDALVEQINSRVSHNDVLYHLGDWSFGGFDRIKEFRERLNVGTIHLIMGNHDHHFDPDGTKYSLVKPYFASITKGLKEIVVCKQEIVLCHYALRVWNRQAQGSWHLYGPSHGSLPRLGNRSMDIVVDGSSYEYFVGPWSILELLKEFQFDSVRPEDHHNIRSQTPPFNKHAH